MTQLALSFVVIGLNEAAHLGAVLAALREQGVAREQAQILFVDSGSDDDSLAIARAAGVDALVEIPRAGANAARARNAGLARVAADFVHFVDGDTRLAPGWAAAALAALAGRAGVAGVEGVLKEARPDHSLAHQVLGMDWPAEPGPVSTLGGNALYRTQLVRDAGGFDARLRLGEDPELSVRLTRAGWTLERLPLVMGFHELDVPTLRDYVRQSYRKGLSCGLVVRSTGGLTRGFWRARMLANLAWAIALGVVPLGLLATLPHAPSVAGAGLALGTLGFALAVWRKASDATRRGLAPAAGLAYGLHTYFSKLPAAVGIIAASFESLADAAPVPAPRLARDSEPNVRRSTT